MQQLKKQLEELTKAKAQHEHSLVANFAQLLNEKKLKIRNQQRLLASATVDPDKGMVYVYCALSRYACKFSLISVTPY